MAIGDTWETINTYTFANGTTIITADFLNDAVNDLQFLYQRADTKVNAWTANTNTDVTISQNTSDVLLGLSATFTPQSSSLLLFILTQGWGGDYYPSVNVGYRINSGAITYLTQETYAGQNINFQVVTGLTVGSSNTITFYGKNTRTDGIARTMNGGRFMLFEMAN